MKIEALRGAIGRLEAQAAAAAADDEERRLYSYYRDPEVIEKIKQLAEAVVAAGASNYRTPPLSDDEKRELSPGCGRLVSELEALKTAHLERAR